MPKECTCRKTALYSKWSKDWSLLSIRPANKDTCVVSQMGEGIEAGDLEAQRAESLKFALRSRERQRQQATHGTSGSAADDWNAFDVTAGVQRTGLGRQGSGDTVTSYPSTPRYDNSVAPEDDMPSAERVHLDLNAVRRTALLRAGTGDTLAGYEETSPRQGNTTVRSTVGHSAQSRTTQHCTGHCTLHSSLHSALHSSLHSSLHSALHSALITALSTALITALSTALSTTLRHLALHSLSAECSAECSVHSGWRQVGIRE
jgi:hypothetical protein